MFPTYQLLAYLRNRLRFLLLLLILLALYAAAGYVWVPYIAQTRWIPELARQHQLGIHAASMKFDPFGFGVRLNGVKVNDASGEAFLSAGKVSVDLSLTGSLRHLHPTLTVELDAPIIRLDRDKAGRWSLAELWPPQTQGDAGGLPVALTRVTVTHGQVEFRDARRGKPVTTRYADVDLVLTDFTGAARTPSGYRLAGRGPGEESFATEGTLSLNPMTVDGTLEVEQLYLPFWLDALPTALPWRIATGQLNTQLHFHIPASNDLGLTLEAGHLLLTDLNATDRQNSSRWVRVARMELEQTRLDSGTLPLSLGRLQISGMESPWGKWGVLKTGKISADPGRPDFRLETAAVENLESTEGKASSIVAGALVYDIATHSFQANTVNTGQIQTSGGKFGSLAGEDLHFNGKEEHLTLGSGEIIDLQTTQINSGRIIIEALDYRHGGKRFHVKAAELTDAEGQGFIETEAAAIPDLPRNPPDQALQSMGGQQNAATQTSPRRARLGKLRLEEARGSLDPPRFAARVMSSGKAEIDLIRRKNGGLEIRGLPPIAKGASSSKSYNPVQLGIETLQLDDYSINFYDETMEPPVRLRFNGLTLKAYDLTPDRENAMEFRIRTQVGNSAHFEAEGRLQLNPLQLSFRFGLDKLRMRSIEPYWKPLTNMDLQRGNLSLWGDVIAREAPDLMIDYAGGAEILEFDAIDRVHRQPALRWDLIRVDGLAISNKPRRFVARVVTAEKPFARVALDENRHLNLLATLEPPNQAAIPRGLEALQVEKTPASKLPSAGVGLLRIKDGTIDFSDRSMKPGFSGVVTQFDGTLSGLTSRAGAKATLSLNGRFNGNAPVNVFGELDPMDYRDHTDVTAQFTGINLTTFSAYSGKFGGYRIEKGKLDMTFNYRMQDGLMEGTNQAVLDQLTLGDRVDDNASWLVDFALFILKNGDGKIDIDLPVYGDLTDPEFNLWTLYRDAFTSLIAKIYYTPVNLFNEAVNGEEAQHFTLSFSAGDTEMVDTSVLALKSIADMMKLKSGTTLDIRGTADPRQDQRALASRVLLEELKKARRVELRAQGVKLHGAPVADLIDEDYQRLFTAYYREKYPSAPEIRAIEREKQTTLNGRLFETAKNKVLDQWPIDETQLRTLAQNRAEVIRGFLIEEQNIPDERLFLRDDMLEVSPDAWVRAALTLEGF